MLSIEATGLFIHFPHNLAFLPLLILIYINILKYELKLWRNRKKVAANFGDIHRIKLRGGLVYQTL
jgi:hypothetical protein